MPRLKQSSSKRKIKYETSAGAIIFYENKKREYLLLLYESEDYNYWGFPKGLVRKKETIINAAFREIKEETALSKSDLEFIPGFSEKIHYFFMEGNTLVSKNVIYFLMKAKTKNIIISPEHIDYIWLPYKEARNRLYHKNHKEILDKAENFLKSKKYESFISKSNN